MLGVPGSTYWAYTAGSTTHPTYPGGMYRGILHPPTMPPWVLCASWCTSLITLGRTGTTLRNMTYTHREDRHHSAQTVPTMGGRTPLCADGYTPMGGRAPLCADGLTPRRGIYTRVYLSLRLSGRHIPGLTSPLGSQGGIYTGLTSLLDTGWEQGRAFHYFWPECAER